MVLVERSKVQETSSTRHTTVKKEQPSFASCSKPSSVEEKHENPDRIIKTKLCHDGWLSIHGNEGAVAAKPLARGNTEDTFKTWIVGRQFPFFEDKIYFMSIRDEHKLSELEEGQARSGLAKDRVFVSLNDRMQYFPFCADFGPLNISNVYNFSQMMKEKMKAQESDGMKIVVYTNSNPRDVTNAVCMICSWLVLDQGWTPEAAFAPFSFDKKSPFVAFRDASFEAVTFGLHIIDVLSGLYRAKNAEIFSLDSFDCDWYDYCDHPAHADLHTIVPGVFVAFKGPHRNPRFDPETGIVHLTPADYTEIFSRLNVKMVVRLNKGIYDGADFEKMGIAFHDLFFEDCTVPDEDVLEKWFEMCRKARSGEAGPIAVHCKAGLGRTGTLIAIWLMRKYRFTAKEVIAYVRVMRPGSVLGVQQQFLEMNQDLFWSMGDPDINGEELLRMSADQEPQDTGKSVAQKKAAEEARWRAAENTEAMMRNCATRVHAT